MATYGGGLVQGGNAIQNIKYDPNTYLFNMSSIALNTGAPIEFNRVTGPQTFIMRYKNGAPIEPTWEFSIRGGMNSTSSSVLPIYSNTATNYGVVDYVPDDIPPRGCTIQVLPKPTNTTRVDIFQITENVTGLNMTFIIAMCPSSPVRPTITLPAPQIIPFGIEMATIFYRLNPGFSSMGINSSYGAPDYETYVLETDFISDGGINPIDAAPGTFRRYNGQQTIVLTNLDTGVYFSFDIDYGIIRQGNSYIGFINSTTNPVLVQNSNPQNCTVVNTGLNHKAMIKFLQYTVTALDGRSYLFTFYPNAYTQQPPTIQKIGGPDLGIESVSVDVYYRTFYTV